MDTVKRYAGAVVSVIFLMIAYHFQVVWYFHFSVGLGFLLNCIAILGTFLLSEKYQKNAIDAARKTADSGSFAADMVLHLIACAIVVKFAIEFGFAYMIYATIFSIFTSLALRINLWKTRTTV